MRGLATIFAVLALPAAAAAAQDSASAPVDEAVQDCSAHKFETFVERIVDGAPRKSRVRLCGKTGQSDAEWIATLEDAIAKVRDNIEMPADARNQIVVAISAEIARLRDPAAASASTSPSLTPRAPPRPRDLRDDYASLPAIPPPTKATPVTTSPMKVSDVPAGAAVPARPVEVAASLMAPSLAFDCQVTGELTGPAPCIDFQRDTLLTIRAKSDVPPGAELHFERNGSDRAKVAIGPMKTGRTKRLPLPGSVCQGVGDGRLTITVWNGARPARTEGPFPLRCG